MINVSEGSQGTGAGKRYALDIAVAVQEGETVESDFEEIKEELAEWWKSRGPGCHELTLAYDAEEEQWEPIVEFWLRVMETDPALGPFFTHVGEVTLGLVTPDGLSSQELSLSLTEEGEDRDAA